MHISTIARLFNRPADSYRGLIRKAIDDEDLIVRVYEPLRLAVVADLREPGKGPTTLGSLLPRLNSMKHAEVLKAHNLEAFARFKDGFRHLWPEFVEDHLNNRSRSQGVPLGDYEISGRFHFSAKNREGMIEHVFVSASENSQDMLTALKELLAIIGFERHGCERSQVVLLDLHGGTIHRPSKSYVRTRRKLESVLQIGSLIEKEYRPR